MPRKEYLPYERAAEERIPAFESVQDETGTGVFGESELIFADCDDGRDFRRGRDLSVRSDFDGFATNFVHASLDFTSVGIELNMLYPKKKKKEVREMPIRIKNKSSPGFPNAGCGF